MDISTTPPLRKKDPTLVGLLKFRIRLGCGHCRKRREFLLRANRRQQNWLPTKPSTSRTQTRVAAFEVKTATSNNHRDFRNGPLEARPVFLVEFRGLARKHGADDFHWALTGVAQGQGYAPRWEFMHEIDYQDSDGQI